MSELRVAATVRRTVIRRAAARCEYCRCPEEISPAAFCVEHIRPRSTGGGNQPANLALACAGCNGRKADRTTAPDPLGGVMVRLFNPRTDRWAGHFSWSEDGLDLVGLSPIGRATISALKLNRDNVRTLRRLLVGLELHPPS